MSIKRQINLSSDPQIELRTYNKNCDLWICEEPDGAMLFEPIPMDKEDLKKFIKVLQECLSDLE